MTACVPCGPVVESIARIEEVCHAQDNHFRRSAEPLPVLRGAGAAGGSAALGQPVLRLVLCPVVLRAAVLRTVVLRAVVLRPVVLHAVVLLHPGLLLSGTCQQLLLGRRLCPHPVRERRLVSVS